MTNVQWYYDNREEPWIDVPPLLNEWRAFSDAEGQLIEDGSRNGQTEVRLKHYTIDLTNLLQYSNSDNTKQRAIMRSESNKVDYTHRRQRFTYPAVPETKSTANSGVYMSPFIQEFIRRHPHSMHKSDFPLQVARGIIAEGKLTAAQMALVTGFSTMSMEQVKKACLRCFTMDSPFYVDLNTALRQNDLSKVDTYGPFCCILNKFLSENRWDRDEEPISLLYRGTDLTRDNLDEYNKNIGKVKSWLAFSSTSPKADVADLYATNTLFIISPATETTPVFPGQLIKDKSEFQEEEEVLLQPGVDFRIEEVNESATEGEKHVIHLTLL